MNPTQYNNDELTKESKEICLERLSERQRILEERNNLSNDINHLCRE